MKFFLDTGNVDQIKRGLEWGLVDGVTTNPTKIAQEGLEFEPLVREIAELVDGPVSAEVISTDTAGMIEEARELSSWAANIVVKIPLIPDGIKAVNVLSEEGIKTNVTLCFSANQAILAAKAGGTYISPFVGRSVDTGYDGMKIVADIKQMIDNYGWDIEIIVSSTRDPMMVRQSAVIGAHIATMPFELMELLFHHPKTEEGLEGFLQDWEEYQANL